MLSIRGLGELFEDITFDYSYIFVRNVVNPGSNSINNFKITHNADNYMLWIFSDNLPYIITPSADSLKVLSITPADYSMGYLSMYSMKIS